MTTWFKDMKIFHITPLAKDVKTPRITLNSINKELSNPLWSSVKHFFFRREWPSHTYSFNKSFTKLVIAYNSTLNVLINSYSNMSPDRIKILFKRRRDNKIRYSANKIYTGRVELEHTNTNISIRLTIYNKQKSRIQRCIRNAITLLLFKKNIVKRKTIFIPNHQNRLFHFLKNKFFFFKKWNIAYINSIPNVVKYFTVNLTEGYVNLSTDYIEWLKNESLLQNKLFHYTKLIHFNKLKFTNLYSKMNDLGLISLIEKRYNKKVDIELVPSKSIHLDSTNFGSALVLKLRDRKNKAVRILRKAILQMVRIPDLHTLITFDDNIEAMNKNNVIKTINQQIVSGVRFEASGRLTRRLTAMRAVFKYRYAGSLKNIRSSFNRVSSTMLRGHVKANSQYTLINSNTRNGTFGLKTWVSTHMLNFSISTLIYLLNIIKLQLKGKIMK